MKDPGLALVLHGLLQTGEVISGVSNQPRSILSASRGATQPLDRSQGVVVNSDSNTPMFA